MLKLSLKNVRSVPIKHQDTVRNTRVSLTRGTMAAASTYDSMVAVMQYCVGPMLIPVIPTVVVRHETRTASHMNAKNATTNLSRLKIAWTRRKKGVRSRILPRDKSSSRLSQNERNLQLVPLRELVGEWRSSTIDEDALLWNIVAPSTCVRDRILFLKSLSVLKHLEWSW